MTQYADTFTYSSSNNGNTIEYDFQDPILRQMLEIETGAITGAADAFYDKAKHGFGSVYDESATVFVSTAAAISNAIPHWKKCT